MSEIKNTDPSKALDFKNGGNSAESDQQEVHDSPKAIDGIKSKRSPDKE